MLPGKNKYGTENDIVLVNNHKLFHEGNQLIVPAPIRQTNGKFSVTKTSSDDYFKKKTMKAIVKR